MSFDNSQLEPDYTVLRSLSRSSTVLLCRERATNRLLVLKVFSLKRKASFQKEAKNLLLLKDFRCAPLLYFAHERAFGYVLGMEYFSSKALSELSGSLSEEERFCVARDIWGHVRRLHSEFGMAHCDISPRNILIDTSKISARAAHPFSYLVDWEFAQTVQKEVLDDYMQFRGTLGYKSLEEMGAVEKDNDSLHRSLEYLGMSAEELTRIDHICASIDGGLKAKTKHSFWRNWWT